MADLFSDITFIQGKTIVIKRITQDDADALKEMTSSDKVYRYAPTFLFERQFDDMHEMIDKLYSECIKESLILGIYRQDDFCGILELYGFVDSMHKVSVGCRLCEKYWGCGISTEAVGLAVQYLYDKTDIEIITASTLPVNKPAAGVLRKNGFDLVVSMSDEDWGYDHMLPTDKWIR